MAAKKRTSTGPKKTLKIGGKIFKHKQCSKKKTDAQKAAAAVRAKGGTARVVTTNGMHCLYTGPRAKK